MGTEERDVTNANFIRVLSVDDHPLFREGIGTTINCQADMSLAGTASNGREGIEAYRTLEPDVVLLDLRLPDLSGLDVMTAIRSEFPEARVVVLTTFEGDMHVQRAIARCQNRREKGSLPHSGTGPCPNPSAWLHADLAKVAPSD